VEQSDWAQPDCGQWIDTLDRVVEDCPGPVIVVAHSLGCLAFAHWASLARERVRRKVQGGFLVAPTDLERENSVSFRQGCPSQGRIWQSVMRSLSGSVRQRVSPG